MRKSGSRSGMTLVEVLISFAVMSIILSVLIPIQFQLHVGTSDQADNALAREYARSAIALLSTRETRQDDIGDLKWSDWKVTHTAETEVIRERPFRRLTVIVTDENDVVLASMTSLVPGS